MSKFVIELKSEQCFDCPFCSYGLSDDCDLAERDWIEDKSTMPKWCPLVSLEDVMPPVQSMRHSTEDENALYEDMLERSSTPLYGPKVYMVHRESGEYSDWTYDVKGIFSTYDAAKSFIESKLAVKCYHYVGQIGSRHGTIDVDQWRMSDHLYSYFESTAEVVPEIVETGMTHPVEKDAYTFWEAYPDGERVWGSCGSERTWFITEHTIDEPFE